MEKSYRHNTVVLAGYVRLNFASEKPGTRQEGITLNSQIRYAGCHEKRKPDRQREEHGKPTTERKVVSETVITDRADPP